MDDGFQRTLDHLRSISDSKSHLGRQFERLMKAYFLKDPLYVERFSDVWLWSEWAGSRQDFDANDTGIDLVAKENDGDYCAIQCKCYAPNTRISKPDLDSFISASNHKLFTARIVVDTGAEWGINAAKATHVDPPCAVIRFGDLASRPFDWPDLVHGKPEDLYYRDEPFSLLPHQKAALKDVIEGFEDHDRGKLVMACGTGKTFTALRIAEEIVGVGGRVLYCVPSIALFAQSMREWATHRKIHHSYIGICSDTRAGRHDEDAAISELEVPVTTKPSVISTKLGETRQASMTVVFCTYHSLKIIQQAQEKGAPQFDLVLCDEAHRTTGIEHPGDKTSPFRLVHDDHQGRQWIQAKKRLYMTATPRIYTEGARKTAAKHSIEVFSMDDPEIYGPEFHCLPFSRAIEQNLLSDYKVVIFSAAEENLGTELQEYLASSDKEINLSDAAKIVGCWRALQNPENRHPDDEQAPRLMRAIAFANQIISSERLVTHWNHIVEKATGLLPEVEQSHVLRCETRHVDGQNHALERKARIEWLKGDSGGVCRILSNARCLSEGIDVPALDAVLFMSPRKSQVEIVQAVGRVMRKAADKKYGYIILPVAIPAGVDPADALDDNERYATVWGVLRALRSHDDRFNAEINKIDLNKNPIDRIIFSDNFGDHHENVGASGADGQMLLPLDLPPGAIYAKIVEKCGDRKYWETWAKDVAGIFSRLAFRITGLLDNPSNDLLRKRFNACHNEFKLSISKSIDRTSAIEMIAQHILTRPVFNALFENYDFAGGNPVARALNVLQEDFEKFGLNNEIRDLDRFYESVRMRAQGLDNSEARQRVLMELYEKFFRTAMKKDAERLGIVYTPIEIVDFILNSADYTLQKEFGRGISDKDVHVLDPFTGTGVFIVRLLQSGLIQDSDLTRKYRTELHANEIVLLAYYIASIHIEEAFRGRSGWDTSHEPFGGIALTDTFNLHGGKSGLRQYWLPDNSERVKRQQQLPIKVIVGNPPWSAGQRRSSDSNPNVFYPEMSDRIGETYAAHSRATLQNSLYDTYKMAFRWASDRIGDNQQGIVAFVTNGSWIDGKADSGVRACMAKEFSTIYVFNLRGNLRTRGELAKREGDSAFSQGTRTPIAITILVRNPVRMHKNAHIYYHDIGDYLKHSEKLKILREAESVAGIQSWQNITPDKHHDWINLRDGGYQEFYPLGSKEVKKGKLDSAIFRLYSRGYATSRDACTYNFSREACRQNARRMVNAYLAAIEEFIQTGVKADVETIARNHSANLPWDRELKNNLRRLKRTAFDDKRIRKTAYRPFVATNCYVDYTLVNCKYRLDQIFPSKDSDNDVICVPGPRGKQPFSALMVNSMPDLGFMEASQCFPRYRYEKVQKPQANFPGFESSAERVDNITDTSLRVFRAHWHDSKITKDDIFYYVYGVLHAPAYRKRFANNLTKELPRVPFAPDFYAFATAGRTLANLHLDYETCQEYPLNVEFAPNLGGGGG